MLSAHGGLRGLPAASSHGVSVTSAHSGGNDHIGTVTGDGVRNTEGCEQSFKEFSLHRLGRSWAFRVNRASGVARTVGVPRFASPFVLGDVRADATGDGIHNKYGLITVVGVAFFSHLGAAAFAAAVLGLGERAESLLDTAATSDRTLSRRSKGGIVFVANAVDGTAVGVAHFVVDGMGAVLAAVLGGGASARAGDVLFRSAGTIVASGFTVG
jgi:hypothetical protein